MNIESVEYQNVFGTENCENVQNFWYLTPYICSHFTTAMASRQRYHLTYSFKIHACMDWNMGRQGNIFIIIIIMFQCSNNNFSNEKHSKNTHRSTNSTNILQIEHWTHMVDGWLLSSYLRIENNNMGAKATATAVHNSREHFPTNNEAILMIRFLNMAYLSAKMIYWKVKMCEIIISLSSVIMTAELEHTVLVGSRFSVFEIIFFPFHSSWWLQSFLLFLCLLCGSV